MPNCANCGASLPEPAPRDDAVPYCRLCQKDRYDASLNKGRTTGIIAGLILAVTGVIALNTTPAGRCALFLLALPLFLPLATLLHELGHAISGFLLGMRIVKIQLGQGRFRARLNMKNFVITLRGVGIGGHTQFAMKNPILLDLRMTLMSLAGPAANLAPLLLALIHPAWRPYLPYPLTRITMGRLFVAANVLAFLTNLGFSLTRRLYQSDLYHILDAFRRDPQKATTMRCLYLALLAAIKRRAGEIEAAMALIDRALTLCPGEPGLLNDQAANLLAADRVEEARAMLRSCLDRPSIFPEFLEAMIQSNLAWANLLTGRADLRPEAEELARQALARAKKESESTRMTAQCVLGSIMAAAGHGEEALSLLRAALAWHEDDQARARTAFFIALAESGLGRVRYAGEWYEKALRMDKKETGRLTAIFGSPRGFVSEPNRTASPNPGHPLDLPPRNDSWAKENCILKSPRGFGGASQSIPIITPTTSDPPK